MGRRVLVCGGRNYEDMNHVFLVLDFQHDKEPIDVIIHGHAPGADSLAELWAGQNRVSRLGFRADWKKHGKAAGPIRNQNMIDKARPDLVIAFPGGRGTADMVRRAKLADITIFEPKRPTPKATGQ